MEGEPKQTPESIPNCEQPSSEFTETLEKLRLPLLKLARGYTKQWDEAENFVQQTFFNATKFWKKFTPTDKGFEPSLLNWTSFILRRVALNWVRDQKSIPIPISQTEGGTFLDPIDDHTDYTDTFNIDGLGDAVKKAFLSLRPEEQTVLRLQSEGIGTEEIAKQLGIRPGTVMSTAFRGRKAIREKFSKNNNIVPPDDIL